MGYERALGFGRKHMMGIRTSAWTASLATLAVAATPGTASAQPRREAITQLEASLAVRHDSNVARSDAQRALERNLTRADQRATPSLDLIVSRPLGRNTFTINASAGYDFYRRNKRLNRERLSFGGVSNLMAGPVTLDLSANFARRQSDPGDIVPLLIPGADSIRNTETTQDYNASAKFGTSPYGLKPMASFGYSRGTNSNDRRSIANYDSTRYGGGVAYDSPALGSFTAQYLRNQTDYPDRPAIFTQSGFTTDRFELTGKRELGAIITASAGVSWISLKPDDDGTESFDSVGYNVSITAVPTPDLQVTGNFSRDVSPSLGTDALYQVGNNYSIGATYQLSRAHSLSVRGVLDDRNYAGAGRVFGIALTESVQRQVSATWAIDSGRPLSVALDVGYQDREANGTFFDYNSFYAGIRTSVRI